MNKDFAKFRLEFYKDHDKIQVPICFYVDDDGNKVLDVETMADEFETELALLDESAIVCCSIHTKENP
tara:strand:- start:67 stop:270 length:204 start_codon:yes stop_codon:yes gene_type:complete